MQDDGKKTNTTTFYEGAFMFKMQYNNNLKSQKHTQVYKQAYKK